jgi:F-type H+-transporting ATPase subunit beta
MMRCPSTEQFSGVAGQTVSLSDALEGCESILRDEFQDVPKLRST